jgi:hypothetical protein
MFYQDSFGVQVVGGDFDPQAPMKRLPEYLMSCPSPDLPPSVFYPRPVMPVVLPDALPLIEPLENKKKVGCSTDGRPIGISPSNPAYECYRRVCERWARKDRALDGMRDYLCSSIPICAIQNWGLPPIDKTHPYYGQCYNSGGSDSFWWPGLNAALGCCMECDIRVCAWLIAPAKGVNDMQRDLGLKKCDKQYQGGR